MSVEESRQMGARIAWENELSGSYKSPCFNVASTKKCRVTLRPTISDHTGFIYRGKSSGHPAAMARFVQVLDKDLVLVEVVTNGIGKLHTVFIEDVEFIYP